MAGRPGRRKKRMRPVNERIKKAMAIDSLRGVRSPEAKYAWGGTPARMTALRGYQQFGASHHIKLLDLNDIIRSLNHNTRILEIGAGSGRLSSFLLGRNKMKPSNYEILDQAYRVRMPWMKKRVYALSRGGGVKVTAVDMFEHNYPENSYDHILIPEAFLAIQERAQGSLRIRRGFDQTHENVIRELKTLVKKLEPSLRENGSIRISYVPDILADKVKLDGFHIMKTDGGLILRKKPRKRVP